MYPALTGFPQYLVKALHLDLDGRERDGRSPCRFCDGLSRKFLALQLG